MRGGSISPRGRSPCDSPATLRRPEGSSTPRARGDTSPGWGSPCCAALPRSDEPPGRQSAASGLNPSAASPGVSSRFPDKRSEVLCLTDPETTRVPVPEWPGMGTRQVAAGATFRWVSPRGQQCPAAPTASAREEVGEVCVSVTEKRVYKPFAQSEELPLNSGERRPVKPQPFPLPFGEPLPLSWQVQPSRAVPSGHL